MGLNLHYNKGQTPIDEDEKEDLLIPTIATRAELDEFEQANILDAIEWSTRLNQGISQILSTSFLREVHKRMFSDLWAWAGSFRQTNKHIVVSKGFHRPVFSWGGKEINHPGQARNIYLGALKAADAGDYRPLIEFARSGSPA